MQHYLVVHSGSGEPSASSVVVPTEKQNSCNFTIACQCRWDGVGYYKDRTGIKWEQIEGSEIVHG